MLPFVTQGIGRFGTLSVIPNSDEHEMKSMLLVGLGGFFGSIVCYKLGGLISDLTTFCYENYYS